MDVSVDSSGLSDDGWSLWYNLEAALMQLHQQVEFYWHQRGSINWTLKGDSLTSSFFAIANGRRRQCVIENLRVEGTRVSEPATIL